MTFDRAPVLPGLSVAALTGAFAAVAAAFVAQSGLGSFADDSVSYLIMAQALSPWQSASQPVAEMFAREGFYPPLFPALLALAGAAYDYSWAHVLTSLLLAACLPLAYVLGMRWLGSRWAAVAAVAVTALLPAPWIQARGILSEPLFSLLLLATLWAAARDETEARAGHWQLALSMAGLVLTRAAGLVPVLAYAAWAFTRRDRSAATRAYAVLPALAAYAAWTLLRPSGASDDYLRIATERLEAISIAASPLAAAAESLARQASSIADAWVGALMLFWVEGQPLRPLLAGAVGALALAGLVMRIVAGKADAWMLAAYLATFLIWPFYDQMTRFLLPALPALVLYAFWTLRVALQTAAARLVPLSQALLALLVLSLAAPALAFIAQRARAEEPYVTIVDWYRTPDLEQARTRAQVQLDLFADMGEIRRLTRPEDRVMWFAPSYIALIAQRRAVPAPAPELAPDAYRRAVRAAGPDYVFLSAFHPRDTIRDTAWRSGLEALIGRGEAVHVRKRMGDGAVSSILLRLDGSSLEDRGG